MVGLHIGEELLCVCVYGERRGVGGAVGTQSLARQMATEQRSHGETRVGE